MFKTVMNITAGAMSASRLRINTIASNIANAQTTRSPEGGPYKRREVVLSAEDAVGPDTFSSALDQANVKGVRAASMVAPNQKPVEVYDPHHPDANPDTGIVSLPDINPVTEMSNLVMASAAYKAAAEVMSVTKDLSAALRRLAQRQ